MLNACIRKIEANNRSMNNYVLSDASKLPFKYNKFDKIYSFTVFPAISNQRLFLKEVNRILKPGGKFVMVSEGMPDFLKGTDFGKIILNNSSLYNQKIPLNLLPKDATKVKIEFILNEIFFLFLFKKRKKERKINDIKIQSKRGGTLYTRYYGKLEGVTLETKKLVEKATELKDLSVYDWLNRIIKNAAKKTLNEK